ncbi:MAG: glucose-1-phosphate adenylyltransferase [Chloroflexi bacterium]|nr:glucose-1-phosphate adenylyltransferase [Chloroflexota bacterium]
MDRLLTIIMAGGTGDRLQPLTRVRSKPAVPFAGKFRLIDFPLSNCINSGIRQIYILIQYRSWSLQKHIQEGWGISSSRLGEYIYCVPAQQKIGKEWYRGTADAIRQNIDLIRQKGFDNVLILSGDHVYKMDYAQLIAHHRKNKAGLTISTIRVKKEVAADSLGVFEVGDNSRIVSFEEKPAQPKAVSPGSDDVLASMGIYIFKTDVLLEILKLKGDDFGRDIIPGLVKERPDIFIYDFTAQNKIEDFVTEIVDGRRGKVLVERTRDSSYWRDVGTIDSYYEASMDLVGVDPAFNLYGDKWVFRTYERSLPPSKCIIGGRALESMVSDGCIISGGLVQRSILSPGAIVERDALVEDSIIFDDVIIEPGVRIRHAIIDKQSRIRVGLSLGYDLEADKRRGCTISEKGVTVVPRSMDISPARSYVTIARTSA